MQTLTRLCLGLLLACSTLATQAQQQQQNLRTVEAKGTGGLRDEALNDALRNAIGMVAGVVLSSQTSVENFELISDAISTQVDGYIKSYDVLSERTDELGLHQVNVKATVTTDALQADARQLAKSVGGIRFLVMYDERTMTPELRANMDFAVERINQFLSTRKYRYIEKTRFDQLRKETLKIMKESDTSEVSYVKELGARSGAQFIILLKGYHTEQQQSGPFGVRNEARVVLDVKTYDNCTAEGLGTVVLAGNWQSVDNGDINIRNALQQAIAAEFDKLTGVFAEYMGEWINNGAPFELRFYNTGTYRDMMQLRRKIQGDKLFGGSMELSGAGDYQKMNVTFRNKPEDLIDKILMYADETNLKDKQLDVKLVYGRQVSFAPGEAVKKPPVKKASTTKKAPAKKSSR